MFSKSNNFKYRQLIQSFNCLKTGNKQKSYEREEKGLGMKTLKPLQEAQLLEINLPPMYLHIQVGTAQLLELLIFLHLFTV